MTITEQYLAAVSNADHRITRAEAAERLGVSLSHLAYLARTGRINRRQNPDTGRVWYDAEEVEQLRARREGSA
jgi:DNA-binding transcriptional MerR regulator